VCDRFCGELRRREPASVPVLDVLDRRGVLHAETAETAQTAAELLVSVLTLARAEDVDPRHVYWGLLERLYNPAGNTQIVNVYFREGDLDSMTCVSAANTFFLIVRAPGEYVRIVERLTSAEVSFGIMRNHSPAALLERRQWLSGAFPFQEIGPGVLLITIMPDVDALPRAVAEQRGRQFHEYDFGVRKRKNSRHLNDVMIQSALTNYAMRGRYDSAGDCDRDTGERGLPMDPSPGSRALDELVRAGPTPRFSPNSDVPLSPFLGVATEEEAHRAAERAWSGGHYLDEAMLIDIDAQGVR
jgi:hypothetical protein